jgi:hypothetical protein
MATERNGAKQSAPLIHEADSAARKLRASSPPSGTHGVAGLTDGAGLSEAGKVSSSAHHQRM